MEDGWVPGAEHLLVESQLVLEGGRLGQHALPELFASHVYSWKEVGSDQEEDRVYGSTLARCRALQLRILSCLHILMRLCISTVYLSFLS